MKAGALGLILQGPSVLLRLEPSVQRVLAPRMIQRVYLIAVDGSDRVYVQTTPPTEFRLAVRRGAAGMGVSLDKVIVWSADVEIPDTFVADGLVRVRAKREDI